MLFSRARISNSRALTKAATSSSPVTLFNVGSEDCESILRASRIFAILGGRDGWVVEAGAGRFFDLIESVTTFEAIPMIDIQPGVHSD